MKAKSSPADGWNSRYICQYLSFGSSMTTLLRQEAGWVPSTILWRLRPSRARGGATPRELQDGRGDVHAGDELGGLLAGGEARPPHDEGYLHGLLVGPALLHDPVLAGL